MKNSTQKFEAGRWYKNIGKDDRCYAKCLRFENDCFYVNDAIGVDNKYKSYNDSSYFSKNNYQKAQLLTDLSEIQQWLPEGHIDKVPTSLVGRYLKALKNNGANIPEGEFGIIKEEGNNYHRTEFTKYGTHSVTFNNGYFELMPVGFCLDNVIPEYVECVNSWHKDWTTGKIYKTEEVQQYFPEKLTVKCDKGIATNVEEWDVRKGFGGGFKISTKELYQAQNKPTIKEWSVGSYIVFLEGYGGHPKGTVDIILSQPSNPFTISSTLKFNNGSQPCNLTKNTQVKWFATKSEAEEFSKSTTESKPMETNNSEFKLGEYVITKDYSENYDGRVLKIRKISNGYCYFEVLDNGYHSVNHNFTIENILRKAKLEEIPTKNLSNEELLDIAKQYFKVGTRFICSNTTQEAVISTANFKINDNCYINEYDDKQNFMLTNDYYHCIYSNKAFAKIISSPNKTKGLKPSVKISEEIEVGDEVEILPHVYGNNSNKKAGDKFIVTMITEGYEKWVHFKNTTGEGITIKNLKLIKKATTTQQTKKDDVLSPKVENKLLNIVKVRKSVPTKTDKKRIKLTIIKPKQLKLN